MSKQKTTAAVATPEITTTITPENLPAPELALVPLDKMFVDPTYQRPLSGEWVNTLAKNWDDRKAGIPEVSERENSKMALLSGQHRAAAQRKRGATHMWVHIYRGLDQTQEAQIFTGSNAMRMPHILDRYRAAVIAGDAKATAVDLCVQNAGFLVAGPGNVGQDGRISAISTTYLVLDWGVLPETLDLIRDAWSGESASLNRWMLMGIGAFVYNYHGKYDRPNLIERLRTLEPVMIVGKAQSLAAMTGDKRVWGHIAGIVRQEYNRHKKQHALAPLVLPAYTSKEWQASNPTAGTNVGGTRLEARGR